MIRKNTETIFLNKARLQDKIEACWLGKNIGGTLGAPIEGIRSISNITGFHTDGIMPNDDLDLQLIWLRAVDELGIEGINAQSLSEYWISYVGPWWSEYGIGKRNLQQGILPPMCGEAFNEIWKHSNGAWIRTEIWACLFPAMPEHAVRFAFEDACVDHGLSEGTWAALFVAAIESAAFIIDDIDILIQIGLSKIPADCHVAHSVNIAREGYKKGLTWQETRNKLVEDSQEIGWFQAPCNIGFLVVGLLYGEGDFRKTVLTAINCGDDTDCTGATAGSILGIAYGTGHIPEEWRKFVGDEIKTICITGGHGEWPESCTEVTKCIMNLLPSTMRPHMTKMSPDWMPIKDSHLDFPVALHSEDDDLRCFDLKCFLGKGFTKTLETIAKRSKLCVRQCNTYTELWLELDNEPRISPGGELSGRVTIATRRMPGQKWYALNWICEEGWYVSGSKNVETNVTNAMFWDVDCTPRKSEEDLFNNMFTTVDFVIHAGENIKARNRVLLEVTCMGRPTPLYVPVILLG